MCIYVFFPHLSQPISLVSISVSVSFIFCVLSPLELKKNFFDKIRGDRFTLSSQCHCYAPLTLIVAGISVPSIYMHHCCVALILQVASVPSMHMHGDL